jgi:hypothetical protein
MGRTHPGPGCRDLHFAQSQALSAGAEVALEDYARTLADAEEAEAIPDGAEGVAGVHLCRASAEPPLLAADVEDFARDLARREETGRGRP